MSIYIPTYVNPGRLAYEGYCLSSNNKSLVSGAELPPFDQLPEAIQQAWTSAAGHTLRQLHLTSSGQGPWVGVDFDGTLATHGQGHGNPIPPVVAHIRKLVADGVDVRVVTARVAPVLTEDGVRDVSADRKYVEDWCALHIGKVLPVTHMKDYGMLVLIDDRAIQVINNTGVRADGKEWP